MTIQAICTALLALIEREANSPRATAAERAWLQRFAGNVRKFMSEY